MGRACRPAPGRERITEARRYDRSIRRRADEILAAGPTRGAAATLAFLLRLAAGVTFVAFGVGKFTSHRSEVESFESYGLPSPEAFTYAIGVIEVVGGFMLLLGLGTRIAALVLAGDMVGAIAVSGIGEGEAISLTLAPALLLAMAFLIWVGPGPHALDHRLAAQPARW